MAKTLAQKKDTVKKIVDKLSAAKGVAFSSFTGLTVSEVDDLRKQLRAENSEMLVTKKTLLGRALTELKQTDVPVADFEGGVAVILGADEVVPAKITAQFAKTHKQVNFYGGLLEQKFISPEKVKELSKLPSKPELYAKLVGTINAPVSGLVNVLAGSLRQFVYVLNALKEKKA